MRALFDDVAREIATRQLSRRAALKALGVSMISLRFPALARSAADNRAPRQPQAVAHTSSLSPSCDWKTEAFCLAACSAAAVQCGKLCATKLGLNCLACLGASERCFRTCRSELNCTCKHGALCQWDFGGLQVACCEAPAVCIQDHGCDHPCRSCQRRNWAGNCVSNCPNPAEFCCPVGGASHAEEGICRNLQTDGENCGRCDNTCLSGKTCHKGACDCQTEFTCPDAYACCWDQCVFTNNGRCFSSAGGNVCVRYVGCGDSYQSPARYETVGGWPCPTTC